MCLSIENLPFAKGTFLSVFSHSPSKFYILDNKYPNFQSRELVRIRIDDPTAGQSNIVVSRSPVQISESAHFFCFLLSLMFSKIKSTAFVGSETDRFL